MKKYRKKKKKLNNTLEMAWTFMEIDEESCVTNRVKNRLGNKP